MLWEMKRGVGDDRSQTLAPHKLWPMRRHRFKEIRTADNVVDTFFPCYVVCTEGGLQSVSVHNASTWNAQGWIARVETQECIYLAQQIQIELLLV